MKLCIATPLYPPELGGPATYARLLEEALPGRGVEVSLVKFSAVRALPPGIRHLAYFLRVYGAARTCDAVLALDPVSTGLPALLAAHVAGKPFFVKIVGDYAWEQGSQRYGITDRLDDFVKEKNVPSPVARLRSIQTYVARHARKIIVPSNYLKGIVSAWGIAPEKIEVIYNAIQAEAIQSVSVETEKLEAPRIVSVGRLVPWKGFVELIDAVAALRAAFPTISLMIVGDGPDREKLETHAKKVLVSGYEITGARSHAEVFTEIAHADIFVLNSTYEGLSHVLIEAQLCGTPTIATNVGGNGEVIVDGVNGLLVESGNALQLQDAITKLLEDKALPVRLRAGALVRSADFSIDAMLTTTAKLLTEQI